MRTLKFLPLLVFSVALFGPFISSYAQGKWIPLRWINCPVYLDNGGAERCTEAYQEHISAEGAQECVRVLRTGPARIGKWTAVQMEKNTGCACPNGVPKDSRTLLQFANPGVSDGRFFIEVCPGELNSTPAASKEAAGSGRGRK